MELPGSEGFSSVRILLGSEGLISLRVLFRIWASLSSGDPRLSRLQIFKECTRVSKPQFFKDAIEKKYHFGSADPGLRKASVLQGFY